MSKHIGIVACSAEGAALCYRTICVEGAQLLGPHDHPQVSLHTHSLARYMSAIRAEDWDSVAKLMLDSAEKLTTIGADFLICPDNTLHKVMAKVRSLSTLPWLHIAEEVANEASGNGYRRLGITGTKYLVESDVYPEKLGERGIAFVRPTQEERERINTIIFEELVYGKFMPEARVYFAKVFERLQKEEGCDAVVLGCTEIPLLISPEDSPLPTLDSTRILSRAALRYAIQKSAQQTRS